MSLSKPTPCLSAIPFLIKEKIIVHLDLPTRLSLSRCSKEFNKLSNTLRIQYHAVSLELKSQAVLLKVSKYPVRDSKMDYLNGSVVLWAEYQNRGDECLVIARNRSDLVPGENHLDLAVSALIRIISNPKAHLESLSIFKSHRQRPELQESENFVRKLSDAFSNYKGSLKTEKFVMENRLTPLDMKKVIEALKPGNLKKLALRLEDSHQRMEEIMDLVQWKQIKDLTVFGWDNIPADKLSGIPRVVIWSVQPPISQETFNALIQGILSHKDTFQAFHLEFGRSFENRVYTRYLQELEIAIPGSHRREKFIVLPDVDWKLRIYVTCLNILMIHKVLLIDP